MKINKIKVGVGVLAVALAVGCVAVKPNALYLPEKNPPKKAFHSSAEIYTDFFTSEGWFTQAPKCLKVETMPEAAYQGELGIKVVWDKTASGCPWLGLGFGWDNWTGKDLSAIKNTAAIEFYVKMLEGERNVLPWAIGLEDYTGAQAWLGMTSEATKAPKVTTEWTRIELPLSEFNWEEQEADASNIKQILIQFEADGAIYIDEIRLVPYEGGYRQRANLQTLNTEGFVVDGKKGDLIWNTPNLNIGTSEAHMAIVDSMLCFAVAVADNTPMTNRYSGAEMVFGDCIELAFGTDPGASPRRGMLLTTDIHLAVGLAKGVMVWDMRANKALDGVTAAAAKTNDGYILEMMIPLRKMGKMPLMADKLYGLEIAIDYNGKNGREKQVLWNKTNGSNFYENPSVWGEMYVLPQNNAL